MLQHVLSEQHLVAGLLTSYQQKSLSVKNYACVPGVQSALIQRDVTICFTFSDKFLCIEEEKTLPNTVTMLLMAEIEPKFCGSFAVGFGWADLSLTHCWYKTFPRSISRMTLQLVGRPVRAGWLQSHAEVETCTEQKVLEWEIRTQAF